MNTPHQVPTFNVKKFGLLAMTPIALVIHGLVLWTPVNTETKKKNEPEKKEELQAIGDIVSIPPIATPASKVTAAITSSTTPVAVAANPVPATTQTIIERIVQAPPIQKDSLTTPAKDPVQPPSQSNTPPKIVPDITPEGRIGQLLNGIRCPGKCTQVAHPQSVILEKMKEQYGNAAKQVNDTVAPIPEGRPDESNLVAYQIEDKINKKFLYFTLDLIEGSQFKIIFIDKQEVISKKGIL